MSEDLQQRIADLKARIEKQEVARNLDTPDDFVTWESWMQAGRWMLPSGWLEQTLIDANHSFRKKGWKDIEIVYVKERTSWMERTVLFKLRGQRHPMEVLQKGIYRITGAA